MYRQKMPHKEKLPAQERIMSQKQTDILKMRENAHKLEQSLHTFEKSMKSSNLSKNTTDASNNKNSSTMAKISGFLLGGKEKGGSSELHEITETKPTRISNGKRSNSEERGLTNTHESIATIE
jgi:hypothetical protein